MSNSVMRVLCWTMAALFPVSLIAADSNGAMLSAKGVVKINGVVSRAAAVHSGDRISTETAAVANLLAEGVSITLPADSSILYGGKQVEMGTGRVLASVTAASGMKARIGNLTVMPAGQNARFQMSSANGKLAIAALEGALHVTDGTHSLMLATGQMMSNSVRSEDGSPAGGGAAASGGIPGWAIGVIVAGAIGGVVGGLAATGTFENASPSKP